MVTDGCTGFMWVHSALPGSFECCVEHDLGGSDGTLLDCLMATSPGWVWPLIVLGILLMVVFRPFYHWLQRRKSP